jgi:hypothetical protein
VKILFSPILRVNLPVLGMNAGAEFFARMETEQKFQDDYDYGVEFEVSEGEQATSEHSSGGGDLDGMDFSDTVLDSRAADKQADHDQSGESIPRETPSSGDFQSNDKTSQNTDQRQQQQSESFLPLPDHPTRQRSAPRAIPNSKPAPAQTQSTIAGPSTSQPNSAGSTASAFLNNLLDPAASTFNSIQISHTPPNQIATSYEASHFGKRARSGVSGLRACSI